MAPWRWREREIQVMSPGICFGLELLVISPTLGPLGSPLGSIRAFRGRDWNAWTLKCAKMWCWKQSDLQLPQNRGFVFLMQSFFPWYQIALKTLKKNMIGSIHLFMFRLYGAIYFLVGGIISLTSTEFDIVQVTPDAGRRLLLDYRCQQGLQVANGVWAQTQAMDFRPCKFSGYWVRMRQHIPKGTMSSCHHDFYPKMVAYRSVYLFHSKLWGPSIFGGARSACPSFNLPSFEQLPTSRNDHLTSPSHELFGSQGCVDGTPWYTWQCRWEVGLWIAMVLEDVAGRRWLWSAMRCTTALSCDSLGTHPVTVRTVWRRSVRRWGHCYALFILGPCLDPLHDSVGNSWELKSSIFGGTNFEQFIKSHSLLY